MEKYSSYNDKARKILQENKYMALATTDKDGKPWAAVVFYAYDADYSFYFLSATDSRHGKNISENPYVAAVIFDSKQKLRANSDVQFEGKASMVGEGELVKVINTYSDRLFPKSKTTPTERYDPRNYSEPSEFRFFKIDIKAIYTLGPDRRVEVSLNEN
jgi:nitroimidazol reductase NimA-like FMN-containing flavoprotein (pyridoxamine 5'-phosphate oxidase superfamily)